MALSVKQKAKIAAWAVVSTAVITSPITVSAVADTKSTTINATVAPVISMTTNATVAIAILPTGVGAASSASDTVTVDSNNSTGYNLTLSNNDTTLDLDGPGSAIIAAHAGTFGTPSTLGNNSWGYRVDNSGTFGAGPSAAQTNQANLTGTWAGVPSSAAAQQIKSTGTTAVADVTTFWYGVKSDTSKASGAYTDSVTYTATTNP
ncbi:MAG: hypothetical protein V4678_01540 [Patescibacteria group bacterium]